MALVNELKSLEVPGEEDSLCGLTLPIESRPTFTAEPEIRAYLEKSIRGPADLGAVDGKQLVEEYSNLRGSAKREAQYDALYQVLRQVR